MIEIKNSEMLQSIYYKVGESSVFFLKEEFLRKKIQEIEYAFGDLTTTLHQGKERETVLRRLVKAIR